MELREYDCVINGRKMDFEFDRVILNSNFPSLCAIMVIDHV